MTEQEEVQRFLEKNHDKDVKVVLSLAVEEGGTSFYKRVESELVRRFDTVVQKMQERDFAKMKELFERPWGGKFKNTLVEVIAFSNEVKVLIMMMLDSNRGNDYPEYLLPSTKGVITHPHSQGDLEQLQEKLRIEQTRLQVIEEKRERLIAELCQKALEIARRIQELKDRIAALLNSCCNAQEQ